MHHSIEKNKVRDKQQGERTAPQHQRNALHDNPQGRTPQKRVSATTPNTTPKTPRKNCESAAQSAPKNNSAAKLRGNQTISPRSNCFFTRAGQKNGWSCVTAQTTVTIGTPTLVESPMLTDHSLGTEQ
jgi:hypothetical protein